MRIRKDVFDNEESEIVLTAKISDALAHPVRIKILKYILINNSQRETVHNKDLVEFFDYSQSTISQHVKKLVNADVIHVRKKDNFSEYYINIGIVGKYIDMLKKLEI
ncbi:MAG: helix-turn-helix domain-containing protein [Clostridia bacterium]|nr:helix-turn-helix domain-containing protein [Clostridia bacterium]